MAKPGRASKTGFVIKLSCETTQKLAEEELQAKHEKLESVSDVQNSDTSVDSGVGVSETELNQVDVKAPSSDEARSSAPVREQPPAADWGQYAPYVTYEGEQAVYTDPASGARYYWNSSTAAWDAPDGLQPTDRHYSYENDTHIYTEPDGSKFFYDTEKKAWIPKVDDDFLAYYQMSYGFVDNTAKEEPKKEEPSKKVDSEKKAEVSGVKRKNEPQWFTASDETNTKVYVSNLPLDMTEQEFVELMSKCGLVEREPATQRMRVRLYEDKERHCFQGDALCSYIKVESVELALKLLDGSSVRGNTIRVERAHFQLKGQYNPALKPKKKKKKELEKLKKMQQKLFDWRPEKIAGEKSKHERVVIIKNLFEPSDFDQEVQLILDYQADLREECGKAGEVRKVTLYDRHPEGVAQVTMKEPEQADAVVTLVNGRWFGKRQITAEIWDGRTKYRIAETDADINKRINKWDKFLETGGEGSSAGDDKSAALESVVADSADSRTSAASPVVQTAEEVAVAHISDRDKPDIVLQQDSITTNL